MLDPHLDQGPYRTPPRPPSPRAPDDSRALAVIAVIVWALVLLGIDGVPAPLVLVLLGALVTVLAPPRR